MALSTQQMTLVEARLANEKKSIVVAYILWALLGAFSAHRFYLGSKGAGVVQLLLIWGGIVLSPVWVGIPFVITGGIWILIDAFLIPGLAARDAAAKRARIIQDVAMTTTA